MAGKPGGILSVGYYPLDTVEYATGFQASDWLYFVRHEIHKLFSFTIKYPRLQLVKIDHMILGYLSLTGKTVWL